MVKTKAIKDFEEYGIIHPNKAGEVAEYLLKITQKRMTRMEICNVERYTLKKLIFHSITYFSIAFIVFLLAFVTFLIVAIVH